MKILFNKISSYTDKTSSINEQGETPNFSLENYQQIEPPLYTDDNPHNKQAQYAKDCIYKDIRDASLTDVHQKILEHFFKFARTRKNGRIKIQAIINFVMGLPGCAIKENARKQVMLLIAALVKNKYCDLIFEGPINDQKVKEFILKNKGEIFAPVIINKSRFRLSQLYADQNTIIKIRKFPDNNILFKLIKEKLSEADQAQIFQQISSDKIDDETFSELAKDSRTVIIEFQEKKGEKDFIFQIIVDPQKDLNSQIKAFFFPMLKAFQDSNLEIKHKLTGSNEAFDFNKIINDIAHLVQEKDPNIDNSAFYKWIDSFEKIMKDLSSQVPEKFYVAYQAACFIRHNLFNTYELQRAKKLEQEKRDKDKLALVSQLLKTYETNIIGEPPKKILLYKAVTLGDIKGFSDHNKKELLGKIYTDDEIRSFLDIYKKEGKHIPDILQYSKNDTIYYFHKWRLLNVFYTERRATSEEFRKRIVKQWINLLLNKKKKEIPKNERKFRAVFNDFYQMELPKHFIKLIQIADQYRSNTQISLDAIINELFPSIRRGDTDVEKYKLLHSDLISTPDLTIREAPDLSTKELKKLEKKNTKREKNEIDKRKDKIKLFLDTIIYQNKHLIIKESYYDILDLDYSDMLAEAKAEYKRILEERKKNEPSKLLTFLKVVTAPVWIPLKILGGIAGFIYKGWKIIDTKI